MRVALIGDFDTFLIRGVERPEDILPYRLSPGLNLLRGLRELRVPDIHIVVTTKEVHRPMVEDGPFGTVHRLPQPKFSGTGTFQLWRRRLILQELRKIGPAIVHGQGTEAEYAFTAVTAPYPHVITIHGIMHRVQKVTPPSAFSPAHVQRWLEKMAVRKAQDVICISEEVESFLREQHSPARRHRVPNAVAPCFYEVRPAPRPHAEFTLLFVGTVYPLKGVHHLIEALPPVQQRLNRPVRLRIIGGSRAGTVIGRYESGLRALADRLGVGARVEWRGVQSERGVAEALAETDVLVLPSFTETFGMCVAEAMAAGVPVVATRAGAIPELVDEGETGLLVQPGNTEALVRALGALLSSADLRSRMGGQGRRKALTQYASRVVAEKTLAVYEEICRGPDEA